MLLECRSAAAHQSCAVRLIHRQCSVHRRHTLQCQVLMIITFREPRTRKNSQCKAVRPPRECKCCFHIRCYAQCLKCCLEPLVNAHSYCPFRNLSRCVETLIGLRVARDCKRGLRQLPTDEQVEAEYGFGAPLARLLRDESSAVLVPVACMKCPSGVCCPTATRSYALLTSSSARA